MRFHAVFGSYVIGVSILACSVQAQTQNRPASFLDAKTCFQTNVGYDPRLAIAVDGVIVHRHGAPFEQLQQVIGSWKDEGFLVGRMFFADSDATNEYWRGKWDGRPHPDEVERDAKGDVVMCSGIRPYMLPTEGWMRYLEEMAAESVEAGADAILPEEPLAHVHTGYEEAFKRIWERRYDRPWEPEKASPEARFLTAQLKNELYIELETRLAAVTKATAARQGRRVPFVLPIHSLYSNVVSNLVAPLGTSSEIEGVDGYIGQIWTGPVNWALHHYDSPQKSFFASAFSLYDYFVQLTVGTPRRLWLLVDPVEDDPKHKWSEFEEWYCHCVAAQLFFPDVDSYEVMPWPDRIFLPGYSTGGGTPAPERFRMIVLSLTQVLQEVPATGQWNPHLNGGHALTNGPAIGVVVADTMMWEQEPHPRLQGVYGLLIPLVQAGVPVSACPMERSGDAQYLDRFKTLILSYQAWKPVSPKMNAALTRWVRAGGTLVVLGPADNLGGADFWWKEKGFESPLHHLLAGLGLGDVNAEGEYPVDKGWVFRRTVSASEFAAPAVAKEEYLPLVELAWRKTQPLAELPMPGYLCMKRGAFIIAHAASSPLRLNGTFVNLFEPDLPVVEDLTVSVGTSGVYRDVTDVFKSPRGRMDPQVLHATHRLVDQRYDRGVLRAFVRGPAETPAVVRFFASGKKPHQVVAIGPENRRINVEWKSDARTGRARFANDPAGVELQIRW